jgi:hypothetical protein
MINERWVVIDNCIFTEQRYTIVSDVTGAKIKGVRKSIAFNIKREVAERIVKLHNAEVDLQRDIEISQIIEAQGEE